jgi:hypothetical protein
MQISSHKAANSCVSRTKEMNSRINLRVLQIKLRRSKISKRLEKGKFMSRMRKNEPFSKL